MKQPLGTPLLASRAAVYNKTVILLIASWFQFGIANHSKRLPCLCTRIPRLKMFCVSMARDYSFVTFT